MGSLSRLRAKSFSRFWLSHVSCWWGKRDFALILVPDGIRAKQNEFEEVSRFLTLCKNNQSTHRIEKHFVDVYIKASCITFLEHYANQRPKVLESTLSKPTCEVEWNGSGQGNQCVLRRYSDNNHEQSVRCVWLRFRRHRTSEQLFFSIALLENQGRQRKRLLIFCLDL